ncbi:unnamed protein product [Larinioides sclopetarius]
MSMDIGNFSSERAQREDRDRRRYRNGGGPVILPLVMMRASFRIHWGLMLGEHIVSETLISHQLTGIVQWHDNCDLT